MTTPNVDALTALLRPMRTLLLDFDGPVCSIFAGYPAPLVAVELLHELAAHHSVAASELADTSDPLHVLRYAAEVLDAPAVHVLANKLRDAEVAAISTAAPTPGAVDLLDAILATGRRTVIVSNNSREAVNDYLALHGLSDRIEFVVARHESLNPRRLKPDRYLLDVALRSSSTPAAAAVMVGDSLTDVEAAGVVGVPTIGFANRAEKREALSTAGAAAIVDDLQDLATAIGRTPLHVGS